MMKIFAFIAFVSILGVKESHAFNEVVKCIRDYKKIGCFKEGHTNMKLIISDRDSSGHELDWATFAASLHSLACRCSMKAKAENYKYFSIRYWGECWAGKDLNEVENILKNPLLKSNACATHDYELCNDADKHECAGPGFHEYIYSITFCDTVNGGYSEWSSWSHCTGHCDDRFKTRERTCTNPMPKRNGKDCSKLGPMSESKKCPAEDCSEA